MENNLQRFGLEFLDSLPSERFDLHIELAYRTASQRRSSFRVETVLAMDTRREEGLAKLDGMQNMGVPLELEKEHV